MNVIDKIEREQMKDDVPVFGPGDTVEVHSRVVEGGKERIQLFKGIVIGRRGTALNQAFTVRKISNGEGVERVFQLHSPKVAKVVVAKKGKVRRAKLHYLRDRVGKSATQIKVAASEGKSKAKEKKASAKAAAIEVPEEVIEAPEPEEVVEEVVADKAEEVVETAETAVEETTAAADEAATDAPEKE